MTQSARSKAEQARTFPRNCPINERTADGEYVGRCWIYMDVDGVCRRHGDVRKAVTHYLLTGELTKEGELLR